MIMPTMSDASRFASRPTAGWWEDRVQAELGYTLHRIRHGHGRRVGTVGTAAALVVSER